MHVAGLFGEFFRDLKQGARQLRLNPGFSAVAVCTLALGIGANSAVFGVVNSLLLRPITAEEPDRLVAVFNKNTARPDSYRSISYPNYVDLRASESVFSELLAHDMTMVGLTEGETTRRLFVDMVSANYFDTFGVDMFRGRAFEPDEELPGSEEPVVIVSYGYWQRSGADPDMVGKTLQVNGLELTIVGVAPRHFTGRTAMLSGDLYLPLGMRSRLASGMFGNDDGSLLDRDYHQLMVVGRLRDGLTHEQADRELGAIAGRLHEAYPAINRDYTFTVGRLARMSISTEPEDGDPLRAVAVALLAMTGIVLLIACINLASMLLARGATRRREFAIRSAIGGGRGRIVRQLLTEGLLLSVLGGAVGLWMAYAANLLLVRSLREFMDVNTLSMNIQLHAAPDVRVVAATAGFCILSTFLFSFGPALSSAQPDLTTDLKAQGGGRHGRRRLGRHPLVVAQIALSLVLLTAAGLFVRGATKAADADPGFPLENGLLAAIDPSLVGFSDEASRELYAALLERLATTPGIAAASVAATVPFGNVSSGKTVRRAEDLPSPDAAENSALLTVRAAHNVVGHGYFDTLGLALLQGRDFTAAEGIFDGGEPVAIIDQILAERLWPEESPLGRQIAFGRDPSTTPDLRVIGVVPSVRDDLIPAELGAHVYVPFGQAFQAGMNVHVRTRPGADAATMLRTVREQIQATEARLPILALQTMTGHVANSSSRWTVGLGANVFSTFGIVSLFLAVVGVYGVKSFAVAQRRREIGIRMALGATARDSLWLILREGLQLTAVGLVIGLGLSALVARLLASFLYDVQPLDPIAFTVAPALLAAVAMFATYVPARRASRTGPSGALRAN